MSNKLSFVKSETKSGYIEVDGTYQLSQTILSCPYILFFVRRYGNCAHTCIWTYLLSYEQYVNGIVFWITKTHAYIFTISSTGLVTLTSKDSDLPDPTIDFIGFTYGN